MLLAKWQDWLIFCVFMAAFGGAVSDDFDYKCKRAHEMSKNETCRMIAARENTRGK